MNGRVFEWRVSLKYYVDLYCQQMLATWHYLYLNKFKNKIKISVPQLHLPYFKDVY